ncbi:MAG: N-acetyl-gamma-glutamyl-phosphate reductase [Gemmatimonadaceae bacterium]|nr:N-acetyl-gamma-glutamyl-phosphate reductase [Gemmatimonadaceae bacterium]NUQ93242.1 N-acetyl-gamma-glutamyl-phosphate reductase [Gemmatimonadaceae bacterium]NUR19982.1 N-acetyl-gamma-glutamyl-phosphate reductase [Gemmatimonadaceae bacterium]NUS96995.1 N-acetyl-gamma-glutamyl-phosphate reductase [Gemmatimonadaceae bacterium]
MNKIPVAVLGGTGYAGSTLCALLDRHPRFDLRFATARTRGELRPEGSTRAVPVLPLDDAPLDEAGVVFSALPHGVSAPWVSRAREAGARVVDLSADLRPGSGARGVPYGLTELAREELRDATVVANPGCYPTAVLLAIAPLLRRGLIAQGATIATTAASGVTGAGASPKRELLFAEVSENYRAYGVGNAHRHVAELQATVARHGVDADLIFTPHLLPVARGILATVTVQIAEPIADPSALWRADFAGEPFVEVVDAPPSLRDVVGRNVARVHVTAAANARRPTLIVLSAIDNLLKGAGGQAVQNANVMLGLDECAGLPR